MSIIALAFLRVFVSVSQFFVPLSPPALVVVVVVVVAVRCCVYLFWAGCDVTGRPGRRRRHELRPEAGRTRRPSSTTRRFSVPT